MTPESLARAETDVAHVLGLAMVLASDVHGTAFLFWTLGIMHASMQEDHSQRAWDIMMWARTHDLFRIYRHAMDAQGLVPDRHYSIHVCLPCAAGVCACVWFVFVELASSGTLYVH